MESSVGAKVVSMLLLLVFALLSFGASQGIDPLCQSQVCAATEDCRVSEQCDESCTVIPLCIPKETSKYYSGGCSYGEPLIRPRANEWEIVTCFEGRPCPADSYCNIWLVDVPSRCCRSDTASPPKPGVCPNPDPKGDSFFCVDACLTDNDCVQNEKCCNTGCAKRCTSPVQEHCREKVCHSGTLCRLSTLGQPECVSMD